jgi:hypothetical protein
MVLVVAMALPFSWLAVEMRNAREQTEAVALIRKVGGQVGYEWAYDKKGQIYFLNARTSEPAWLWNSLGDDFFVKVVVVSYYQNKDATDHDVARLVGLRTLERLDLTGTGITDSRA